MIRRVIVALGLLVATLSPVVPGRGSVLAGGPGGPLRSDFNGDGFVDLVVGAPGEHLEDEYNSNYPTVLSGGAVHVLYSSDTGVQAEDPDDQFFTQDSPGVRGEAELYDRFGAALAAGDFNGDGFGDLAIGIPGEDVGAIDGAGAVQVLYGSGGGLQALNPNDQLLHQNGRGMRGVSETGDMFGSSLATRDFNDDGFEDLAIGIAAEDLDVGGDVGAVQIVYGSASRLQFGAPDDQLFHQDSADVEDSSEPLDSFGYSLAADDYNRDHIFDLAIGIPGEDYYYLDVGAVAVLYGSANGLQATSPNDQFIREHQFGRDGDDRDDLHAFGSALAAGNFDRSAGSDLAVGVPGRNSGTVTGAGAVLVLEGSASGLEQGDDGQILTQSGAELSDSAEEDDQFGFALAVGDFNSDLYPDLAVGVPYEDLDGSLSDAGAVAVVYGSTEGLRGHTPEDGFIHQNADQVEETAEEDDRFGASLTAADLNGDTSADLVVGISHEQVENDPLVEMGAVQVLYGSESSGLQAEVPNDQFLDQDAPADAYAAYGQSHAAGDFDGDGFDDLAIGAPGDDVQGVGGAGSVEVRYGTDTGLDVYEVAYFVQGSGGVQDAAESGDAFGWALASADFNGDGFDDLAVAVYSEDTSTVDGAGAAAILYGSAGGLQADAPDDQLLTQDSPDVKGRPDDFDNLGSSLVAADFDGDGFGDLAIGITGENDHAGEVAVLYGSASGLQATAPDDDLFGQDSSGVQDTAEPGDLFGWTLAAGDLDADGFDDLAIGIPFEDDGTVIDSGAVAVVYGSDGGVTSAGDQFFVQGGDVKNEVAPSDQFGSALAVGRFDDDEYADLAIGVPFEDGGSAFDAGAVSVLYGSSSGAQATSPNDDFFTQNTTDVADDAEDHDRFGWTLTAADFNGDEIDDVGIGITVEDGAGKFAVLFGSDSGLQATYLDDELWGQDDTSSEEEAEYGDQFGWSLADGDFNGNGHADIVVGVLYEDVGTAEDVGVVHVMYGTPGGIFTNAPVDQFLEHHGSIKDEAEDDDEFGFALNAAAQ